MKHNITNLHKHHNLINKPDQMAFHIACWMYLLCI